MKKDEETKSVILKEQDIWEKHRLKFKDYSYNEDWKTVINIFENRIEKKFIEPLKILRKHGNNEGSGFSMVAIECLLIELFAAFREGKNFNHNYSNEKNPSTYQYGDCKALYVDFLTTVYPFNSQFSSDSEKIKKEAKFFPADKFYTEVRCGLLHEGKTKGDWTINLKKSNEPKEIFLKKGKNQLKIFRTTLLKKIEEYLTAYILELKGKENEVLRKNFARKMDHLYFPRSKKAIWWKE